jgi:mycothiol system anti-sigma-R factor
VSCGKPHERDCSDVLAEVYLYLDAESDEIARARIEHHLDECAPCLREYGIEQEVKALVARHCGGDRAPEGLRERLLARIREVVVVTDADTDQVTVQSVTVEQTVTVEVRER